MDSELNRILDDSLARIQKGETIEACLERYPERARDLAPLLRLSELMRQQAAEGLPAEMEQWAATTGRHEIETLAAESLRSPWQQLLNFLRRLPGRLFPDFSQYHLPMPVLSIVLLLMLFLVASSTATNAVAGQMLYSVKRSAEEARLAITTDPRDRSRYYLQLARSRVDELSILVEQPASSSADVDETFELLVNHAQGAMANGRQAGIDSVVQRQITTLFVEARTAVLQSNLPTPERDALVQRAGSFIGPEVAVLGDPEPSVTTEPAAVAAVDPTATPITVGTPLPPTPRHLGTRVASPTSVPGSPEVVAAAPQPSASAVPTTAPSSTATPGRTARPLVTEIVPAIITSPTSLPQTATPRPTRTPLVAQAPTSTPVADTATPQPSPTAVPVTPSATATSTPLPTNTRTATSTPSPTNTRTATSTPSPTNTRTATSTPSATASATPTATASATPTATASATPTATASATPTATASATPTVTTTPVTEIGNESELQAVAPILECVVENEDRSLTAYFAYSNPNDVAVELPIGATNRFVPGPVDRGQPVVFRPGRSTTYPDSSFSIDFQEATTLVWFLDGKTATASERSSRCEMPLIP